MPTLLELPNDALERKKPSPRRAAKQRAAVPWSYGLDRLGAAAIDPDRLYVYWEVTDPAIARAREALGDAGKDAWLNLRVHDTTGRIFDGTNAHGYFDQGVGRGDRQWFFTLGKPTSTAVVELGLKTAGGDFVRIARAGRVEFPRARPAPSREPEWMTVHASGAVERARVGRRPHRGHDEHARRPGVSPPPPPTRFDDGPHGGAADAGARREERHVAWHEVDARWDVEGEHLRVMTTWEAGPFAYPIQVEPPSYETWRGPSRAYRVGNVTHVIEGTWHVLIRNLGAWGERQILGHWEIRRSWIASGGSETRSERPLPRARPGASELALGASERRWLAGSELRLGGASERRRIGASELRLGGASERLFAAASEWRLGGASERLLQGGSEHRLQGGNALRTPPGASERRLGASPASTYPKLPGGRGTP